jgi:hypothetical protein
VERLDAETPSSDVIKTLSFQRLRRLFHCHGGCLTLYKAPQTSLPVPTCEEGSGCRKIELSVQDRRNLISNGSLHLYLWTRMPASILLGFPFRILQILVFDCRRWILLLLESSIGSPGQ